MNSRAPTVIGLMLAAISGAIIGALVTAILTLASLRFFDEGNPK
jgi:uncharacterized integral membrane protein